MGNKTRREVDINVPHRHHLTGVLEATFYLHIGQRSIPRQIDLAFDEGLDQGIVAA
jgi:predicted DNA-binding transcriptional regulator AlpA